MSNIPPVDPRGQLATNPRYASPDESGGERTPLGGWVAPRGPNLTPVRVARAGDSEVPVYYPGDEYALLRSMTPRQIAQLQTQLAAAGFIGPNQRYIPGNAETTRSQFRDLLAASNGMGVPWRDTLRQLAAAGHEMGGLGGETDKDGGGAVRQIPTYEAPNRDDISAAIRRGMYSQFGTHGHGIDVGALTDAYLAQDRANFDKRTSLWEGGGGGAVESTQSLEGFVEAKAREQDATGVDARQWLDRANSFVSMLAGPMGGS